MPCLHCIYVGWPNQDKHFQWRKKSEMRKIAFSSETFFFGQNIQFFNASPICYPCSCNLLKFSMKIRFFVALKFDISIFFLLYVWSWKKKRNRNDTSKWEKRNVNLMIVPFIILVLQRLFIFLVSFHVILFLLLSLIYFIIFCLSSGRNVAVIFTDYSNVTSRNAIFWNRISTFIEFRCVLMKINENCL